MAGIMMRLHAGRAAVIPGPPQYISNGGKADRAATGGTPLNVSYPASPLANDVAILQAMTLSNLGTAHTITTPSGWTLINQSQLATIGYYRHAIFYKVLTGSESGSVGITTSIGDLPDSTDTMVGIMSLWRGVLASGTPYEALANNTASSSSMTGSSVTTLGVSRTVLNIGAVADDFTTTPGGSFTEQYDVVTTDGNEDGGLKLFSVEQPAIGTVGATTHTLSGSDRWQVCSFALLPA